MPNSLSAKKRLRQNVVHRLRNRSLKSAVRGQIRTVRMAIADNDVATGKAEFRLATKKLDQAAARGVMHANAAARTKSRLSAALKTIEQNAAAS